ncbi:phage holin family protein [Brassicibacter mesophilus]|uniref:phage holin family protein n=1 Tax=Brassicibacter mesophilus TaxID=745119 RepID=UPI003D1A09BF
MSEYIEKALSGAKPYIAMFLSMISYLMFPDSAYETAAIAVGITMLLDIVTKYMALSHEAHGYKNAVKTRLIFSGTLWAKTRIKLTAYLIIAILAGLAYRVTPLQQVGVFFGTVVYAVIFLRESQSILENLSDAGADVGWLIRWTKKKQDKILDEDGFVQEFEKKVDDKIERI